MTDSLPIMICIKISHEFNKSLTKRPYNPANLKVCQLPRNDD